MGKRIAMVAALFASLSATGWGQVRLGPELPVSVAPIREEHAKVATVAAGAFVVVWTGREAAYPGHSAIFARRFDATGAPAGDAFQVSASTPGWHERPSVASVPDGGFVVAWQNDWRESLMAPPTMDVFARRYDASGTPLGDGFRVNETTTDHQGRPSIARDGIGNFVIVWRSFEDIGAGAGVFGRRYDASGVAQGLEFAVNSYATSGAHAPAVASDADGNFVVAWSEYDEDQTGVFARRFAASGVPVSGDFRVNSSTTHAQIFPSIAADPAGNFVVVWQTRYSANQDVYGQLFDATGAPRGGEFAVNTFTTGIQAYHSAAFDANGNFAVAWSSTGLGGFYASVARLYDASGMPQGAEFIVNSYTTGSQGYPSLAFDAIGNFVVAWQSAGQLGSSYDIVAQRFAPDLIFRDGFESGGLAAWSASATDDGDLVGAGAAALKGTTFGLEGTVDDPAGMYVEDDSPRGEGRYRTRVYVNPVGFDPGEGLARFRTRLFIAFEDNPSRRVAAVVLRRQGGLYALMARARRDDNSQADTGFFPISAGPHFVEIDWQRSTGPAANDGSLQMWIDGTVVSTLTGLDNSESAVDLVRLGALSVKAGASGTIYWDEFESRRLNYIGP